MNQKLEVKLRPADASGNCFYGIFDGETLVFPLVRNKAEGELVCAAVNAIRACAEPLGIDPLDFAKRLEEFPHVGQIVVYATDMVEDVARHVVEGEPLEGGPPTGLLGSKERDGPDA